MSSRLRMGWVAVIALVAAAFAGTATLAPTALASTMPSLSLDQSAGHSAGATANLGMDLKFADSGGDKPKDLTIELPPGLLANAAIDHGACLRTTSLLKACQVGSGTVAADGLSAVPVPVGFDLVAPPTAGDLAGLAVDLFGSQLGATAGISVRPSGDPDGVGITIRLVLPKSVTVAGIAIPITVTEIDSTFDALRYPTSCPSPARRLSIGVNSYADPAVRHASAPLEVSGCSALAYAPRLAITVTKAHAPQVALRAAVTEPAVDAPTGSMTLSFPGSSLYTNIASVALLCRHPAAGTCTPVGTATAASPLYPRPLRANVYLTGDLRSPTLTIAFPQPFPLTLVGSVVAGSRTTTFQGLPDIPLTSLSLALNGGPDAPFQTHCAPSIGVARSKLTDENADRSVSPSVRYRISGCPPPKASGAGRATISAARLRGLRSGRPTLSFTVHAGPSLRRLASLTVALPRGLRFDRVRGHARPVGVAIAGARANAVRLVRGRLQVSLRAPASRVRVRANRLVESRRLRARARSGRPGSLRLTVTIRSDAGRRQTLRARLGGARR